MVENYDLIIIGAGPAGLTAAIYAGRQKLKMVVLEGKAIGGQQLLATTIENYPGFMSISGQELTDNMKKQVDHLGVEIRVEEVVRLKKNDLIEVEVAGGKVYKAKAVIIATGATHRQLGIPGEKEFLGKGVSYCATCDGAFFKGKTVAVIGGGNTAVDSAIYLDDIAKKVYLIHRRQGFRADTILMERLKKSKVEQILDTVCEEIQGDKIVNNIKLKNVKTNKTQDLNVDGVFIQVGETPLTALAEKVGIKLDDSNYITINRDQETNIPGILAAGDVTGGLRQTTTAVGEGAIAALSAYRYIKTDKLKGR